ncbi:MAG: hypothetical protein K0R92_5 [Lachnospiraceae bacterium]|jgi:RimJ/RimL family protein N-acetyltransferase|nr:hypothetical protein [Lachnospiraceae bacterium]
MDKLITERLILRQPEEQDCAAILDIHNSFFVLQYNAMKIITEKEMLDEIKNNQNNTFYIERKESGEVIGAIFIDDDFLRYKVNSRAISYYLGEKYIRNGYMFEALKEVIKKLFCDGYDIIAARAFSENKSSIGLLKKLGFSYEGCIRHCVKGYGNIIYDDMIFSLLQSEWEKINKSNDA